MDLESVKRYIDLLRGKEEEKLVSILKTLGDLTREEKNLIYRYLYPRRILDKELPGFISKHRNGSRGSLVPDDEEAGILVEAYRGPQYSRYVRHLLHSFLDPSKVYPLAGDSNLECGICKKPVYQEDAWKSICSKVLDFGEQDRKEYLCFASKESDIVLCLNCIVQLQRLDEILRVIEGENYLKGGF